MGNEPVSVIIPTFNRRHSLCECIDSVLMQSYDPVEIIIVDDCSEDDTVEYVTRHYKGVALIKSVFHLGPAHLRNMGLSRASGTFVLFLDSDVVLPNSRIIGRMVEQFDKDPRIGLLGGEIPVYLGATDYARGLNLTYWGNCTYVNCERSRGLVSCDYLATCNCMARKKVIESIGGFDPYYRFGSEDLDLGYRLKAKGLLNFSCYQVAVYHRHVQAGRNGDQDFRYKYARIRFMFKHFPILKNLSIFLMDLVFVLLFYVLMVPKIVLKKYRSEKLASSNFLGGYLVLKAYFLNLINYRSIRKAKNTDFLKDEEMGRFEEKTAAQCGKF